MNNPSTMIKSITEKLEFLNRMEEFYQKVQEMLRYLGIKSPSKPDFNYYSELIKQRKQDLAFARWTIQRQYRKWFMVHMSKTELIKMYKSKEQIKKVYNTAITEEETHRYVDEEGPPRKRFSGIYTGQKIQLN
jgi:hypothetical protein